MYIMSSQIPKISAGKTKTNLLLFSDCRQACQKNRSGKMTTALSRNVFYEYKVGHLLTIGDVY
jgi:hypothetical protein